MATPGPALHGLPNSFEQSFMSPSNATSSEHQAVHHGYPFTQLAQEAQQDQIYTLHSVVFQQQQQIAKLQGAVGEVTRLNEGLFRYVGEIKDRIATLERSKGNVQMVTMGAVAANKDAFNTPNSARNPDQSGPFNGSWPTFGPELPMPVTPRTITSHASQPPTPTTPGTKPSQTLLHKRESHNLTQMLPPATVRIPLVPLTDVELIVFFYNCVQRPIVSLRLYARNWGPSDITRVLNDHRDIKPDGYNRNTCSVKCTTAIKRGRERHGSQWETRWRQFFVDADDADATDVVRKEDVEICSGAHEQDYRVLDLLNGLKKFPVYDNQQTGMFSRAVEWCAANQVDIGLSMIHKIVIALEHDADPADALQSPETSPVDETMSDDESVSSREDSNAPVDNVCATGVSSTLSEVDEELLALVEWKDTEESDAAVPTVEQVQQTANVKMEGIEV